MLRQETSSSECRLCVGGRYKYSKGLTANQSRPSGSTTAGSQALWVPVASAN